MFPNDYNFADTTFGYPTPEDNGLGPAADYPFELTNGGPSTYTAQTGGSDPEAAMNNLSAAEIERWWLASKSDGGAGQYAGSTLLDSRNEFAGPYDTQIGYAPGTNESHTDDVYGLDVLRQQYASIPEYEGFPTAGPSTASYPVQPAIPLSPPATFTGPETSPSPVPTLTWGSTETYTAAGNDWPGMYYQPQTAPNLCGQWPHSTSDGKGKGRATDHVPPSHPSTTGNTTWRFKKPYTPEDYNAGSNPQTGIDATTAIPSAQVVPSTGPRRFARRTRGKGKEADKDEGKRKRIPKKDLAPGIDWPSTCSRFCAEMAKICFDQLTGEVPNPETAYARIAKFIKEDLHLSPLAVKHFGERQSRDLEQYLTGILSELRPPTVGGNKGVRYMLERVAEELVDGLVVANDDAALPEGPSSGIDPEKLGASEAAVRRRAAEQDRRDAIRGSLERMALFFKPPQPGYLWSRPQVLFYAITYLMFGARVFGDEGDFFIPKPQL